MTELRGQSNEKIDAAARRRRENAFKLHPVQSRRPGPTHSAGEDSALVALHGVALFYRLNTDATQLAHDLALGGRPANSDDILRGATLVGMRAERLVDQTVERLEQRRGAVIIRLNDDRYVVVGRSRNGKLPVFYAHSKGVPTLHTAAEVEQMWTGEMILFARAAEQADGNPSARRFGFGWFLTAAWNYRNALLQVLLASLFVQLFALITPLFFQVVIDKVLVHNSGATLDIVVFGMISIGFFDVVLQYLRAYALSHTASRLDVELGRKIFDHLLKLPLSYFETRPTGQTIARVREVEVIRNFLTGQGLTSLIDIVFALVFVSVLALYSFELTLIILCSIPFYLAVVALFKPLLRRRIKERFQRNAANTQFLVESVVGIQTLKATAVEPLIRTQWEEKLAAYVKSAFRTTTLGNAGQNVVQYINKVTTAMVLLVGAKAVMGGKMTVGELIAFNMIANQLVAPIIRLSQLWQDFQQIQVSVERIGDVLETPAEYASDALSDLPPVKGAITFQNVSFRYSHGASTVLSGIDLSIRAGEVVGIVGPSGSGKSTLTKLIQRLYLPHDGQILVDDTDIALVRPAWLRQQIGVVLQENLLFSRTVHENIALAVPFMSREAVVATARLAGAHEFICKMPRGYDTRIEERGANLSGGQRQRIAIARALARNPRILIFDEATSALDYESEKVIQQNMRHIVRGRTVIVIAHRLAAVRNCQRIIGIDEGRIVEEGTHEQLLNREGGLYRHLWSLQNEPHG
jgi:subfamily B ATP-binding cassette protein HlyB/CyaB